jgi:hypothetical protein
MRRSLAISIALHFAAFGVVALLPAGSRTRNSVEIRSIEAVLVSMPPSWTNPGEQGSDRPGTAVSPPGGQEPPTPAETPAPAQEPSRPAAKDATRLTPAPRPRQNRKPVLTEVRTLFTASALALPRGRVTLADLATAAPDERVIQLCMHEAIEQVRRAKPALHVDFGLAEARQEARLSGLSLEAKGGAIHGGGRWFDLAFRCRVAADLRGVVAFAFAVGKEISPRDRAELDLPTEGAVH